MLNMTNSYEMKGIARLVGSYSRTSYDCGLRTDRCQRAGEFLMSGISSVFGNRFTLILKQVDVPVVEKAHISTARRVGNFVLAFVLLPFTLISALIGACLLASSKTYGQQALVVKLQQTKEGDISSEESKKLEFAVVSLIDNKAARIEMNNELACARELKPYRNKCDALNGELASAFTRMNNCPDNTDLHNKLTDQYERVVAEYVAACAEQTAAKDSLSAQYKEKTLKELGALAP